MLLEKDKRKVVDWCCERRLAGRAAGRADVIPGKCTSRNSVIHIASRLASAPYQMCMNNKKHRKHNFDEAHLPRQNSSKHVARIDQNTRLREKMV